MWNWSDKLKSDKMEDAEAAMRIQGQKKRKKTASAFILSEVSVHLNKPRMNSWAEEQGCLKDK